MMVGGVSAPCVYWHASGEEVLQAIRFFFVVLVVTSFERWLTPLFLDSVPRKLPFFQFRYALCRPVTSCDTCLDSYWGWIKTSFDSWRVSTSVWEDSLILICNALLQKVPDGMRALHWTGWFVIHTVTAVVLSRVCTVHASGNIYCYFIVLMPYTEFVFSLRQVV